MLHNSYKSLLHQYLPHWIYYREKYGKKGLVSGNFLYCLKKPDFYQDTNATIEEPSTYQELTVPVPKSMLPYDNITLK